jgi:hypothetical protein
MVGVWTHGIHGVIVVAIGDAVDAVGFHCRGVQSL